MDMKIAVIGAAGKAGRLIVEEAITRGHQVMAIVRTPNIEISPNAEILVSTSGSGILTSSSSFSFLQLVIINDIQAKINSDFFICNADYKLRSFSN